MHDYDSAQTPILIDGMFNGKKRKLLLTAARNGYYFTLDRVTGERLVTASGNVYELVGPLDQVGAPQHDAKKDATIAGSLVSPTSDGTTNWEPITYSPIPAAVRGRRQRLFDVLSHRRGPARFDGPGRQGGRPGRDGRQFLTAIDYRTGELRGAVLITAKAAVVDS